MYVKYKKNGWKPILEEVKKPEFPEELQNFLDEVTEEYFLLDAFELEMMIHRETPWIESRGGLPIDEPSHAIISQQSMTDYFKAHTVKKDLKKLMFAAIHLLESSGQK